jgi:class 3 adenylate cyclase
MSEPRWASPQMGVRKNAWGAVMDLGGWLRSLGLERYEAAFRENDIDDIILPRLTADDLKDLGVDSLSHRRKLLDAITALRDDASGKRPFVDTAISSSTSGDTHEDRAERRQVTVVFSDLVDSTILSGRMDPEDFGEVVSAYQRCATETVQRFGGFVAAYTGDGVIAYLGYPEAHEDDAGNSSSRKRPQDPRAPADARSDRDRAGGCRRLIRFGPFR